MLLRNRRGPSSHLISAVRVTSTAVRGVVREGDIKTLDWWKCLFVELRRGTPPPLVTTPAKAGETRCSTRQEKRVDHGADQREREAGGGGPSGGEVAGGEAARGHSGERGERRGAISDRLGAGEGPPPFPLPFPPMLSPVFSFEAAFDALRMEVAGDDNREDYDIGCIAETDHLSGHDVGGERFSNPEAAEPPHTSSVDGARDAVGGERLLGLCRSSEPAGSPSFVDSGGDDTQQTRRDRVERRQRREGLVRRPNDAASAVVEVKGVQVEMKTSASKGEDYAAGDDLDTTKVRGLIFVSCGRVTKDDDYLFLVVYWFV